MNTISRERIYQVLEQALVAVNTEYPHFLGLIFFGSRARDNHVRESSDLDFLKIFDDRGIYPGFTKALFSLDDSIKNVLPDNINLHCSGFIFMSDIEQVLKGDANKFMSKRVLREFDILRAGWLPISMDDTVITKLRLVEDFYYKRSGCLYVN